MARVSRKPAVTISAVTAPLRSISALVASVVPWMTWPMAPGATPAGLELLGFPADAAVPTVIVIDAEGIVRFIEVADNYRLRPDPQVYLPYLRPASAGD